MVELAFESFESSLFLHSMLTYCFCRFVCFQFCSWDGFGNDRDTYVNGPKKAVLCVPLASKINKEKKANWIPIFNLSQKDEDKIWETLVTDWKENPYISGDKGECESTIIRFGSLLGGGPDGPMQVEPLCISWSLFALMSGATR